MPDYLGGSRRRALKYECRRRHDECRHAMIGLKPLSVRKVSADQVIERLRRKFAVVPGATLFLQANQDLNIGGRQSIRNINSPSRVKTWTICTPGPRACLAS